MLTEIAKIHQLKHCDAVLTGYIGSAEQGKAIIDIVKQIKISNPAACYFCDPVMGHAEKGCIVAPGVAEFLCYEALPICNIMAPNLLELETLVGKSISNVEQALLAARELCQQGQQKVLVKHLSRAGYHADCFEMLLVTKAHCWHISRPLIYFGKQQPVGVGDLTSGLMFVNLLNGKSLSSALEHVAAAAYEVVLKTKAMHKYELQLVAAQDKMANPAYHFKAVQLD